MTYNRLDYSMVIAEFQDFSDWAIQQSRGVKHRMLGQRAALLHEILFILNSKNKEKFVLKFYALLGFMKDKNVLLGFCNSIFKDRNMDVAFQDGSLEDLNRHDFIDLQTILFNVIFHVNLDIRTDAYQLGLLQLDRVCTIFKYVPFGIMNGVEQSLILAELDKEFEHEGAIWH